MDKDKSSKLDKKINDVVFKKFAEEQHDSMMLMRFLRSKFCMWLTPGMIFKQLYPLLNHLLRSSFQS